MIAANRINPTAPLVSWSARAADAEYGSSVICDLLALPTSHVAGRSG
jgi:hypothetical protein